MRHLHKGWAAARVPALDTPHCRHSAIRATGEGKHRARCPVGLGGAQLMLSKQAQSLIWETNIQADFQRCWTPELPGAVGKQPRGRLPQPEASTEEVGFSPLDAFSSAGLLCVQWPPGHLPHSTASRHLQDPGTHAEAMRAE